MNWHLEQQGSALSDGTFLTLSPSQSLTLSPSQSLTLDLVYLPQAVGASSATFRFVHNDSQYPGGTPLEMALTGTGIATQDHRHFVLAPESGGLSFGSSNAGDTTIQVVTVSNAATASEALSLWLDLSDQVNYAVQVDGVEISYGSLIYGGSPGAPLLTLSPGESKQVEVLYKPETPGEHVSSVHIRHDDADYQPGEVLMTVWGVGLDGERKRYYYLSDHLGSVRATVNETGEVVHYDDYYPFGLQMPGRSYAGGDEAPKERYTGHELDEETDLYYAGARYLDPVIGRWLAVDPKADDYASWSPYNYVLNNPLGLVDPDGECPVPTPDCVEFVEGAIDGAISAAQSTIQGIGAVVSDPAGTAQGILRALANPRQTVAGLKQAGNELLITAASGSRGLGKASGQISFAIGEVVLGSKGVGSLIKGAKAAKAVDKASGLGDLLNSEVNSIQNVVDAAGRPLEVVGSAARGTRRGVGTDLPIGKGGRSDIDYLVPNSSIDYFRGLEGGLPSIDPNTGIIPGTHNPFLGPAIRFEPGGPPKMVPEKK